MSKALRRRLRAFIDSLDEFTNKQEPSAIKNMFVRTLWVEIIVKEFPFLEWVGAKFFQQLKELLGECRYSLGCEVLAGNATAPVGTGNHDCLAI